MQEQYPKYLVGGGVESHGDEDMPILEDSSSISKGVKSLLAGHVCDLLKNAEFVRTFLVVLFKHSMDQDDARLLKGEWRGLSQACQQSLINTTFIDSRHTKQWVPYKDTRFVIDQAAQIGLAELIRRKFDGYPSPVAVVCPEEKAQVTIPWALALRTKRRFVAQQEFMKQLFQETRVLRDRLYTLMYCEDIDVFAGREDTLDGRIEVAKKQITMAIQLGLQPPTEDKVLKLLPKLKSYRGTNADNIRNDFVKHIFTQLNNKSRQDYFAGPSETYRLRKLYRKTRGYLCPRENEHIVPQLQAFFGLQELWGHNDIKNRQESSVTIREEWFRHLSFVYRHSSLRRCLGRSPSPGTENGYVKIILEREKGDAGGESAVKENVAAWTLIQCKVKSNNKRLAELVAQESREREQHYDGEDLCTLVRSLVGVTENSLPNNIIENIQQHTRKDRSYLAQHNMTVKSLVHLRQEVEADKATRLNGMRTRHPESSTIISGLMARASSRQRLDEASVAQDTRRNVFLTTSNHDALADLNREDRQAVTLVEKRTNEVLLRSGFDGEPLYQDETKRSKSKAWCEYNGIVNEYFAASGLDINKDIFFREILAALYQSQRQNVAKMVEFNLHVLLRVIRQRLVDMPIDTAGVLLEKLTDPEYMFIALKEEILDKVLCDKKFDTYESDNRMLFCNSLMSGVAGNQVVDPNDFIDDGGLSFWNPGGRRREFKVLIFRYLVLTSVKQKFSEDAVDKICRGLRVFSDIQCRSDVVMWRENRKGMVKVEFGHYVKNLEFGQLCDVITTLSMDDVEILLSDPGLIKKKEIRTLLFAHLFEMDGMRALHLLQRGHYSGAMNLCDFLEESLDLDRKTLKENKVVIGARPSLENHRRIVNEKWQVLVSAFSPDSSAGGSAHTRSSRESQSLDHIWDELANIDKLYRSTLDRQRKRDALSRYMDRSDILNAQSRLVVVVNSLRKRIERIIKCLSGMNDAGVLSAEKIRYMNRMVELRKLLNCDGGCMSVAAIDQLQSISSKFKVDFSIRFSGQSTPATPRFHAKFDFDIVFTDNSEEFSPGLTSLLRQQDKLVGDELCLLVDCVRAVSQMNGGLIFNLQNKVAFDRNRIHHKTVVKDLMLDFCGIPSDKLKCRFVELVLPALRLSLDAGLKGLERDVARQSYATYIWKVAYLFLYEVLASQYHMSVEYCTSFGKDAIERITGSLRVMDCLTKMKASVGETVNIGDLQEEVLSTLANEQATLHSKRSHTLANMLQSTSCWRSGHGLLLPQAMMGEYASTSVKYRILTLQVWHVQLRETLTKIKRFFVYIGMCLRLVSMENARRHLAEFSTQARTLPTPESPVVTSSPVGQQRASIAKQSIVTQRTLNPNTIAAGLIRYFEHQITVVDRESEYSRLERLMPHIRQDDNGITLTTHWLGKRLGITALLPQGGAYSLKWVDVSDRLKLKLKKLLSDNGLSKNTLLRYGPEYSFNGSPCSNAPQM